jgi:O-methyltransferase domain/Dimerisation domain
MVKIMDDQQSSPGVSGDRSRRQTALGALNKLFYEGYMISRAIYAVACLGIADVLKDGPLNTQQIAAAIDANPDALYRLLRALASVGVFEEVKQSQFALTPLAAGLRTDVPGSLRAYIALYGSELVCRPADNLLSSVRTGFPAFNGVFGMSLFPYLNQNSNARSMFDAGMASISSLDISNVLGAYDFSGIRTIADIGGGDGRFLTTILLANRTIKGILFDQPLTIEGARTRIETEALADRCDLIGGDFFDAVPGGADAYILKRILHDFDDDRAIAILRNCRRAMSDKARILVIEPVVLSGDQPSLSKFVDLMMLVMTEGGRERSEQELRVLFEAGGFGLARVITGSFVSIVEGVPV